MVNDALTLFGGNAETALPVRAGEWLSPSFVTAARWPTPPS